MLFVLSYNLEVGRENGRCVATRRAYSKDEYKNSSCHSDSKGQEYQTIYIKSYGIKLGKMRRINQTESRLALSAL